ncbi:hypothetical protein GRF59_04280 [Paenibacillus sp. HJL G12]|uniref:Uncharacterized protein n=1 Tax=Paenibacillus dendrobii TaxID=2691084 RepID=A0A7X3IFA6_9BACL|nr:DUF2207 domain-containing protein [Paenibacillus dendrobii]MWV42837.1 hypothetical protein [Paenibacillus dendrobii]
MILFLIMLGLVIAGVVFVVYRKTIKDTLELFRKFNVPDPSTIVLDPKLDSEIARYRNCFDIKQLEDIHTELKVRQGNAVETTSKIIGTIYLPMSAVVLTLMGLFSDLTFPYYFFWALIIFILAFIVMAYIDSYFTQKNKTFIEGQLVVVEKRIAELEAEKTVNSARQTTPPPKPQKYYGNQKKKSNRKK